jgi:hypothetical protein
MKVYLLWCFDGIEETGLHAVHSNKERAEVSAAALQNQENAKVKSNSIRREYYVEEWDVEE